MVMIEREETGEVATMGLFSPNQFMNKFSGDLLLFQFIIISILIILTGKSYQLNSLLLSKLPRTKTNMIWSCKSGLSL